MAELCATLAFAPLLWLGWFLWQDWRLRRALRRLDQPPTRPSLAKPSPSTDNV